MILSVIIIGKQCQSITTIIMENNMNRFNFDVMVGILEVCKTEMLQYNIAQICNLSYHAIVSYSEYLIKHDLIKKRIEGGQFSSFSNKTAKKYIYYTTTDKDTRLVELLR